MSTEHWSASLTRLGACDEAVDWATTQPDLATAWRECGRADWMLWLMRWSASPPDRHTFVAVACDIARTVLHLIPEGEMRPLRAIEVARAWLRGEATQVECRAAADAAAYAARAARAAYADAAYAAADAAYAAADAARAAYADAAYAAADAAAAAGHAARAAADAAYAAYAAADDAARVAYAAAYAYAAYANAAYAAHAADIIRRHYPQPPELP